MERVEINSDELAFHSLSFNDENGRLFVWQGDIYRAIPSQRASLYQNLLQQKVIEQLVSQKQLIETELTPLKVRDYELVLKHRRIKFVSYPKEWCGKMLKDAALLHLDLCLALEQHGLITGDANPLNILFDRCQPIFIDLGSIEQIDENKHRLWCAYDQFYRCFVNPLKLIDRGQGRIARWLIQDYERGILTEDIEVLTAKSPLRLLKRNSQNFIKSTLQSLPVLIPLAKYLRDRTKSLSPSISLSRRAFFEHIRQEVVNINLTATKSGSHIDPTMKSPNKLQQAKLQIVASILSDLEPASVLEIGNSNSDGVYAQLAAQKESQAVFFTPEESLAEQLYLHCKQNQLSVLPLFIDFVSPSCDLSNAWFAPASDRLNCDLTIALDLIDWLVFEQPQCFPFDRIVERLSVFTKRWLLTEFVIIEPPHNQSLSSEMAWVYSWYKLDNFIATLHQEFSQVDTLERISGNNVLLLCQK